MNCPGRLKIGLGNFLTLHAVQGEESFKREVVMPKRAIIRVEA